MAEWTEDNSNTFTKVYDILKDSTNYAEFKGNVDSQLFPKEPLPYNEALRMLLGSISQYVGQEGLEKAKKIISAGQKQKGGLEAKVSAASTKGEPFSKLDNVLGLAGIVGTVVAFAAGVYPIAVAAAAVTLTSLYSQYQKSYQHKPA